MRRRYDMFDRFRDSIKGNNTMNDEYEARIEDRQKELRDKSRKRRSSFRLIKKIGKAAIKILTNPITWIVIGITTVLIYVIAGLQLFGQSDYNIDCSPDGVGTVSIELDVDDFTRQTAIVDWLTSTDFPKLGGPMTKEQAAGVVGNMIAESAGGKPHYVQTRSLRNPDYYKECDNQCVLDWGNIDGLAIGFLQWDGGRRTNMVKFAEEQGKPWYDLNIQLHWLKKELEGYDGDQLLAGDFHMPGKTPSEYAVIWNRRFERSSMADDSPNVKKRSADAEEFAKRYKGGGGAFGTTCVDPSEFANVAMGPVPNEIAFYQGIEMSRPIDTSVATYTGGWGPYRPMGELLYHRGVDLASRDGQEGHALYSMIDGTVTATGYDGSGWGNWVLIQSNEVPSFSIRYAHLQTPAPVTRGDKVKRGQYVGPMGNTGMSTAPHVHVEFLSNGERFNPELAFNFKD